MPGKADLSQPAIGTDGLPVDPAGIGTSQEGHHTGNVIGLTKPFQWCHLGKLRDLFVCLAAQEQLGCDRSGGDGIDRDLTAAQFLGINACHGFDRGLGGVINRIARQFEVQGGG